MKIGEITGRTLQEYPVDEDLRRPHPKCSVGIEVEIEGVRVISDKVQKSMTLWGLQHDGSLQNGIELVSQPVWGSAITDSLDQLRMFFKKYKAYLSFRTSVHIHVNVLDLEPEELEHFIKLYLFYEPSLFRLHMDWNRYENIFCVPARKSVRIQDGYAELLRDVKRHGRCGRQYVGCKYAAMNPNSVGTFGTLEFRHMGGTDNVDRIDKWINILLQMKVAAQAVAPFDQPSDVFGRYSKDLVVRTSDIQDGWNMLEYVNMQGEL